MAVTHIAIESATAKISMANILDATGLCHDEWNSLMFEYGCQHVEAQFGIKWLQYEELTLKERGFWDWWVALWVKDDSNLLSAYQGHYDILKRNYQSLKSELITL